MKSYIAIMQCRRVGIKMCGGPRKEAPPEDTIVQRYKSKQGRTSLIFDPRVSINVSVFSPDNMTCHAVFDITMAPLIADRLAEVYNYVIDDKTKLYTKDDHGTMIMDTEKAHKSYSRILPTFNTNVHIYPGIDYDAEPGDERKCIMFQIDEIAAPMPLGHAKQLIRLLDKLDCLSYQMLVGIMDQLAKVDATTERLESMLKKVLANQARANNSGKSSSSASANPYGGNTVEVDWGPVEPSDEIAAFNNLS